MTAPNEESSEVRPQWDIAIKLTMYLAGLALWILVGVVVGALVFSTNAY